jgi:LmbE family N-acetylglucosaminyl deacetylase
VTVVESGIDILWVLAHPDDESFGSGGTMLLAHDAGMTTGLICATRGEVGEIRFPHLATRESLAAVREQELRRAMQLAKLTELRLLGYRDSGMAGTPENADPRALVNAPFEEAVAHVAAQIQELRPRSVISFGPDGVYGHPDHIAIGAITDAAVLAAANGDAPGLNMPWKIDAYYHSAASRERIQGSAKNPDSPFRSMPPEELEKMGIPEEQITHWIDAGSKVVLKQRMILEHATQISAENPVSRDTDEFLVEWLGRETYARQDLPWTTDENDPITQLRDLFPSKRGVSVVAEEIADEV